MVKPALTRREREIMDILHQHGRATAQEVQEHLPDAPSYSAVRALLRLLEERGHAKHTKDGSRYVYVPSQSPSEARRKALSHVVTTFFGGSVERTLLSLIETSRSKLSEEELDRLALVVEEARRKGK